MLCITFTTDVPTIWYAISKRTVIIAQDEEKVIKSFWELLTQFSFCTQHFTCL